VRTDEIRARLSAAIRSDSRAAAILKKIAAGRANFSDTMEYSLISGRLTGRQLSAVVTELAEGREELAEALLRDRYDDINARCAEVQTALDDKQGLHLAPQKAEFPKERTTKFTRSLTDPTVKDETIKRRARSVSENITVTFHDDFIKENAKFRDRAGLKCYVTRSTSGNCCPWCSGIAGRYLMSEQPEGLFGRHDNCDCTIVYDGQVLRGQPGENGRRGRKWAEDKPKVEYAPPRKLSRAEAEKLQAENLPKRLTGGGNGGIISINIDELVPCLRDNQTGELVQTEVRRIRNFSELRECTPRQGWDFPWNKPPRDSEVYALSVAGSKEIEGLIALRVEQRNQAVYMYWGNAAPHNRVTESNPVKKFNGVGGHLFAVAIHRSLQSGLGGYVYADAANKELLEHFVTENGAVPIPTHDRPYRFIIEGKAAKTIFESYNFDWR